MALPVPWNLPRRRYYLRAPKREGGKVFGSGSRTPIAITLLVKNTQNKSPGKVNYFDIGDYLTREEKLAKVTGYSSVANVPWLQIRPNSDGDWINQRSEVYSTFLPLGDRDNKGFESESVFTDFTQGIVTNKDAWCYNFSRDLLIKNIEKLTSNYNQELKLYKNGKRKLEEIKNISKREISWSAGLLDRFEKGKEVQVISDDFEEVAYRPFTKTHGYRNDQIIHRQYRNRLLFPKGKENIALATISTSGSEFGIFAVSSLFDRHFMSEHAYPLYRYALPDESEGTLNFGSTSEARMDGVSDWALSQFQSKYKDKKITKLSIFHYVYAVLISPDFANRYGIDAKKLGPRVPLVLNFWEFASAGEKLIDLHTNYQNLDDRIKLDVVMQKKKESSTNYYSVKKMKLIKNSVSGVIETLIFNENIKIENIPPEASSFRVNGRTPLEWVVTQQELYTDKDTQIVNDPNEFFPDEKGILNLAIGAIKVSILTTEILKGLPTLELIVS